MSQHSEREESMNSNTHSHNHDDSNEWLANHNQQPASASVVPSIMESSTQAWLTPRVKPIRANVTFVHPDQTTGHISAGQRHSAPNSTIIEHPSLHQLILVMQERQANEQFLNQ